MTAVLMDGDRVVREVDVHYGVQRVRVPLFSKDRRCCCTRPAQRVGMFCVQEYRLVGPYIKVRREVSAVFRLAPRAKAFKLTDHSRIAMGVA